MKSFFLVLALVFFCTAAPVVAQVVPGDDITLNEAPPVGPVLADEAPTETPGESASPSGEHSAGEIVQGITDAYRAGKWVALAGFVLLALGYAVRKGASFVAPDWAASKSGGKVLGGGSALAIALGAGLAAGDGLSADLVLGAVGLAGAAAGFWSLAPKARWSQG